MQPLVIISGGQTGVDRGALDAALLAGAACGGWCPEGRLAEDGTIAARYPVVELPGAGYPERTRANVRDSDGTLIIAFGEIEGGTRHTLDYARSVGRPVCIVDADPLDPLQQLAGVRRWIDEHRIRRLNVAGPRASKFPGAYDAARRFISALLVTNGRDGVTGR